MIFNIGTFSGIKQIENCRKNFPHKQSVLMHNLDFYTQFMKELHDAVKNEDTETFLRRYTTENQASLLVDAIKQ